MNKHIHAIVIETRDMPDLLAALVIYRQKSVELDIDVGAIDRILNMCALSMDTTVDKIYEHVPVEKYKR